MDTATILELVKARVGISSKARDTYFSAIIDSVIEELEKQKGLTLESESLMHQMFIVDYAVWRYQARDQTGAIPRHLQFRLHNLIISNKGDKNV